MRSRDIYPDEPKSLDEWYQRIQWALWDQKHSMSWLTMEMYKLDALEAGGSGTATKTGRSTVRKWLAGNVNAAQLRKLLKAAKVLGLNERWLIFRDGSPYGREHARLPFELEGAIVKQPIASRDAVDAVVAFYERHRDLALSEEQWRHILAEFEQARRHASAIVELAIKDQKLNSFETRRPGDLPVLMLPAHTQAHVVAGESPRGVKSVRRRRPKR